LFWGAVEPPGVPTSYFIHNKIKKKIIETGLKAKG
jgi:hypothetical protein